MIRILKNTLNNIKRWFIFTAHVKFDVRGHDEIERIEYIETRIGLINILIHYKGRKRVDNFLSVSPRRKISVHRNKTVYAEKI